MMPPLPGLEKYFHFPFSPRLSPAHGGSKETLGHPAERDRRYAAVMLSG